MNCSYGSNGAFPVMGRDLALRATPFAADARTQASARAIDCDAWSVGSDDRAEWDAALDSDLPAAALDSQADSTADSAVSFDTNLEAVALTSPTVFALSASDFSQTRGDSDGDDPHNSPSTRFQLLLGESSPLQVDWSRQLTHWSLCLRTADAQAFDVLSRSAHDMSAALQAGFGCDVAVQVDRE